MNPTTYSPQPNTPRKRKPTKTISGVAPLAVMLPPRKCDHGTCLYCPSYNTSLPIPTNPKSQIPNASIGAPQSYTPESPAVLRAKQCKYDPSKQVKARLKAFKAMGHPTDKIELIIMGGTFLSYPEKFQYDFITKCYQALNGKLKHQPTHSEANSQLTGEAELTAKRTVTDELQSAKKTNETAIHRVTALCIETRPDVCNDKHIKDMLTWGTTRIELGVQAIDDKIYKKVNRGHKVKDVVDATARLKKAGFKIGYHLMPGIPGSNPKKDIQMFKKIFKSQKFKPDQIKIYPCQVLKGAGIENLYYGGEYVPYSKEQAQKIIIEMLKLTPRYCRIMRIMREIPPSYLIAGIINIDIRKDIEEKIRNSMSPHGRSFHGSLKQVFLLARNFFFLKRKKSDIEEKIRQQKTKIKEIRFREIGFAIRDKRKIDTNIKIKITKYKASNGTEYFIEAINKDGLLFGLLRLRIDFPNPKSQIPNTSGIATVRELHVYGPALKLSTTSHQPPATGSYSVQHKGLGKRLITEAEKISKKKHFKKLRIISGVGVREYYKALGYKLDKDKIYMEKLIFPPKYPPKKQ